MGCGAGKQAAAGAPEAAKEGEAPKDDGVKKLAEAAADGSLAKKLDAGADAAPAAAAPAAAAATPAAAAAADPAPAAAAKAADPAPAAAAPAPAPATATGAAPVVATTPAAAKGEVTKKKMAGSLGVIRLDYNYPPAPGDIDHPGSFEYDVYYRAVPGLSFEMCQNWQTQKTAEVEQNIIEAVKFLDVEKGVSGFTGDCGFMMFLQSLVRQNTKKPVFMSSLAQLPGVTCAYAKHELIAILTANGETLAPMKDLIRDECGVDTQDKRFVIVGCQDVPGFDAVAAGGKVDVKTVTPGMIAKAKEVLAAHPNLRGFMMECTELPPYSDAIRHATGLPVYDAITSCNAFMAGVQDNPLFGLDGWHFEWDGKQEKYTFGDNLGAADKLELQADKAGDKAVVADTKGSDQIIQHTGPKKAKTGTLGVIRLDYNYPPAPGDIDHPGSFEYDVFYRAVPGLSFEICQNWATQKTPEVEANLIEAIKWLDVEKGVSGITGDCGFMMYLQTIARQNTTKPVFMSSLAQLPAVTCAFAKHEQIAILTANGQTLTPMRDLIRDECGVDTQDQRFIIVGCEDVPGFEAVAAGDKVDVAKVTPGMIAKAKAILEKNPNIRGFMMECTELPPYSDAVRHATGLPVWDAITSCNAFIAGVQDNPRFGLQGWQHEWDGVQDEYTLGKNLSAEDKAKLENA